MVTSSTSNNCIPPSLGLQPVPREHALALTKIREWLAASEPQVFRLFGLAGSGKTTLARRVADMVAGEVAFVAFAGKAAMALRQRGCLSATTIHSLIYNVEDYSGKVHFILKQGKQAPQCALIIVDECSTVDADVAKDLLSYQIRVLTLGDPFQLPSIDGIEFFMNAKPDATLTEVLRQEKNSPILELAARARQNLNLECGRYGDSEILPLSQLTTDHLLRANQILVGTNEMRHRVNREMRNLLGFSQPTPEEGDKLICLRSAKKRGFVNGSTWSVMVVNGDEKDRISLLIQSEDQLSSNKAGKTQRLVRVPRVCFEADWETNQTSLPRFGVDLFGYGYALTVHKAQGSGWDDVLIIDDGRPGKNRDRWLYTSLTRAARRVTLASSVMPGPPAEWPPPPDPYIFPEAVSTEKAIVSAMISQTLRSQTPSAMSAARQAKNALMDRRYREESAVACVRTMLVSMYERGALIITDGSLSCKWSGAALLLWHREEIAAAATAAGYGYTSKWSGAALLLEHHDQAAAAAIAAGYVKAAGASPPRPAYVDPAIKGLLRNL
jgi:exodeoxyribonuclease V